jgi:hypothetical protein
VQTNFKLEHVPEHNLVNVNINSKIQYSFVSLVPNSKIKCIKISENEWLMFNATWVFFPAISWRVTSYIWCNDADVRFALDQHAEFDLYSSYSLEQQSVGRHVAPLGHFIRIPSLCSYSLNTSCLSVKQQIPYIIAFRLTRPGLEHTIYHTRGEQTNHYNTDFKIASSNSVRFCEHPNPVRLSLSPFLINKPFKGTCSKSTIQVKLAHYIFNTNFQNKK